MPDADKPEPVRFPVVVTVNGVRVEVVLMLRPGTTVTREEPPRPTISRSTSSTGT